MQKEAVNEEAIWAYIDGTLPDAERAKVTALLKQDGAWRQTYQQLFLLQQQLLQQPLAEPSMRFTKNVMEAIAQYSVAPAAKSYINKNIIWSISGFFLIVILGLLLSAAGTATSGNAAASTVYDGLKNINYTAITSSDTIKFVLMLNIVLALLLLEKWITVSRKKWA